MRTVSGQWNTTLREAHAVACTIRSYYDGTAGRFVPLITGQLTYDLTTDAQRRCTLTIPLYGPDGFRWDPGSDPLHPLATNGQQLKIDLGITHPSGIDETVSQGFYLVSSVAVDEEENVVQVQGTDLMSRLIESKIFLSGDSVLPLPTDTHLTAIDKLTWPALHSAQIQDKQLLPTLFDTLPVFNISGTISIRDGADRIEIINRILETWPARMYVDDDGKLHFSTPITGPKTTPDVTVTGDTTVSTVLGTGRAQDRRRPYNAVKVSGQSSSTGAVTGAARSYTIAGPMSVRGPYGMVTRWYQSDMVTSNSQAQTIANALLAQGVLFGRTESITCVPNPAIQIGDTVRVTTTQTGTFTGLCVAIVMPLTAAGGPMTMTVTNVPLDSTTFRTEAI